MSRILMIDADSIKHILGWKVKDFTPDQIDIKPFCDSFMDFIIASNYSDQYIGIFSPKKTFRHNVYTLAPYKGNRKATDEHMKIWGPEIEKYFIDNFNFIVMNNLEADDGVAYLGKVLQDEGNEVTIATTDKDLLQTGLNIFDYKKVEFRKLTEGEAIRFIYYQCIVGDSGDNIKGVPGLGPKKADEILDLCSTEEEMFMTTLGAFSKKFGAEDGMKYLQETFMAVKMVDKTHPLFEKFKEQLEGLRDHIYDAPETLSGLSFEELLNASEWGDM